MGTIIWHNNKLLDVIGRSPTMNIYPYHLITKYIYIYILLVCRYKIVANTPITIEMIINRCLIIDGNLKDLLNNECIVLLVANETIKIDSSIYS